MENIMDVTTIALRGDAVDRLSSQIHESRTATRRGLESAVPVSIAGLAQHFSGEQRAEELLDTIRDGTYPHADVQEVSKLVSDPTTTTRIAQSGQGFLSRIFGNKLGGIVDALAGQSGVSRASASTLLGLAAPLVLDAVGKEAEARHLDARGLSRFLTDQARVASGSLPAPISGAIGALPSEGGRIQEARHRVGGAFGEARERVGGSLGEMRERIRGERESGAPGAYRAGERGKMLPWLLAGVIVLGLITLIIASRRAPEPIPEQDFRTPEGPVIPAPRMEAPRLREETPPAVTQFIVIGPNSEPLVGFLAGTGSLPQAFILEGVEFDSTSARVKPNATLDGVAQALKQAPNTKIRLEGHADPSGPAAEDAALAAARANAVKNELVGRGIAPDRIEAIGRAPGQAATESGAQGAMASDRRVDLIVIER